MAGIFSLFAADDKRLGRSQGKRIYDLPLNKDAGTGFLILLIALMSFLAMMALSASFAMQAMTERWSSGLENNLTIEVPAEKKTGGVRTPEEISELETKIVQRLEKDFYTGSVKILEREEVQSLLSPWLGNDSMLDEIPMPGLISVELQPGSNQSAEVMRKALAAIDSDIVLDTHETWLNDILKLTGALRMAALVITLIIGLTTLTAIAGAIRSRMAVHREDVELLHLMGANDEYITRQFQRHALIMGLQGSLAGCAAGAAVIALIWGIAGQSAVSMLPALSLNPGHILILLALPLIACLIAALTARFTVLHVLALMP